MLPLLADGHLPHGLLTHTHLVEALTAAALIVAYTLMVLAAPTHVCWHCHGKPKRGCRPCKNTGRQRHFGATAVHRFYWLAIGNHLMARRRADLDDQLAALKENSK